MGIKYLAERYTIEANSFSRHCSRLEEQQNVAGMNKDKGDILCNR